MNKVNVSKIFTNIKSAIVEHSPEILTGLGIAGMITTTVLAVRATPKAISKIEAEKKRQNNEYMEEAERTGSSVCPQIDKLTVQDTIKTTWKCYVPAAVTGAVSIGCLIGATSVNSRRNALLATAYKLSESAFIEYKEKVVETIGEKKERAVKENMYKDRMEKQPVSTSEVIVTNGGTTLCYDYQSGRYFYSDKDKIAHAVNKLNKKILDEDYASLNEFYYEIGLSGNGLGDEMGWNSNMKLIELDYSSQLSENGTPCLVIDFNVPPKYGYNKFY